MSAIQKGKKLFILRISVAFLIAAICGGSVFAGYPAYADDIAGEAPAIDAGAPPLDSSAPSDEGAPSCDVEKPAANTGVAEVDINVPETDTADTDVDIESPVDDARATADDGTVAEIDEDAPVDDLESSIEDTSAQDDSSVVDDAEVIEEAVFDSTASASTGQSDYLPGDTVDISGEGFAPNAEVMVTLTKPDGTATEWTVTADAAGQIATNYELTEAFEGAYFVSLSDGNNTGATLFTDPVTILRPSGNGTTGLNDYPSAGANYLKVDDAPPGPVPDGDSTYVYINNTSGRRDLYAMENLPTDTVKPNNPVLSSTSHTPGVWSNDPTVVMVWSGVSDPGSPTANSVTAKAICRATAAGGSAAVGIRPLSGTETWSTAETLSTSYDEVSAKYDTNPRTEQAWTYNDINNLQAGVKLWQARSTMVWLEVSSDDTLASGVGRYYYEWNDQSPDNWMASKGTGVEHTVTQTLTQGTNRNFYVYARDNANNRSDTIRSGPYWIDLTNPNISGARTPGNAYGWNNDDVTVSFTANDALSGIGTVTPETTVSSEGVNQSITGTATDKAGNSASTTVNGINIDKTKPTIGGSVSPGATPYGWHNTDVTVHFNAEDNLSGIDTVSPDMVLSAEGANQSASGTATDKASNSASATVGGINIDKTAPTISGSRITAANPYGWNNTDVMVSFTANDVLSGVATVTPETAVSSEGANQSVTGTATDKADNSASTEVGGINIDKTNPVLTDDLSRTGMDEITVTLSGNDALSGVDFIRYSPDGGATWTTVYSPTATFTISGSGEHNLSNLVFDIAGNEYTMDRTVSLEGPAVGEVALNPTLEIDVMGTVASYPMTPDGRMLADVKVASPDKALVLEIPSGGQILNEDGTPASQVQIMASDMTVVPEGYQMISAYQFAPKGIIFPQEATLTMNYTQQEMPEYSMVVMAFYDEAAGKWAGLEKLGTVAELGIPEAVTSYIGGAGSFAVLTRVP